MCIICPHLVVYPTQYQSIVIPFQEQGCGKAGFSKGVLRSPLGDLVWSLYYPLFSEWFRWTTLLLPSCMTDSQLGTHSPGCTMDIFFKLTSSHYIYYTGQVSGRPLKVDNSVSQPVYDTATCTYHKYHLHFIILWPLTFTASSTIA